MFLIEILSTFFNYVNINTKKMFQPNRSHFSIVHVNNEFKIDLASPVVPNRIKLFDFGCWSCIGRMAGVLEFYTKYGMGTAQ